MGRLLQRHDFKLYREQLPIIGKALRLCGRAGLQTILGRKKALNPDIIGEEYSGKPVAVTPWKIQRFAEATKDANPLYSRNPPERRIAPPMFCAHYAIHSLMKLFADKRLNLDFSGMLHAGQDIEFLRLLRPGERVFATSFVKKIVDKGKGEILVTNTHFHTVAGELVGKGYSSWYVRKPKHLRTAGGEEFRQQLYWEPPDGKSIQFLESVEIDEDQTLRYAKISGDYNPVHISDFVARLMGEGRKIVQGMCTMAIVAGEIVNAALGGDPYRLKRLNVRFLNNVRAGDVLKTYYWHIDPAHAPWSSFWIEKGEKNVDLLGLRMINQKGDVVVSRGVAKVAKH